MNTQYSAVRPQLTLTADEDRLLLQLAQDYCVNGPFPRTQSSNSITARYARNVVREEIRHRRSTRLDEHPEVTQRILASLHEKIEALWDVKAAA